MKCEYCGTDGQTGERCNKCGAIIPKKNENYWKSEPFFYNGYLVVYIRNMWKDTLEVQFWLGIEMQCRFEVSHRYMEEIAPEGVDPITFFWDLFLLEKGEKEVLHWKNKNEKPYVRYEIRRIEDPPVFCNVSYSLER